MKTTEFIESLEQAVESRDQQALQSLGEIAERHPELLPIWEEHLELEVAIEEWKAAKPHVQLSDAVISSIMAKKSPAPTVASQTTQSKEESSNTSWHYRSVILGGSLLVILVGVGVWLTHISQQHDQNQQVAKDDSTRSNLTIDSDPTSSDVKTELAETNLTELFRQAGSSYQSLADETVDSLSGGSVLATNLTLPAGGSWSEALLTVPDSLLDSENEPPSPWMNRIRQAVELIIFEVGNDTSAG